jgi:hypothetical protein
MNSMKRRILRALAALIAGSTMLVIGDCNVQYPPSDTNTVVGVAISPGGGTVNNP